MSINAPQSTIPATWWVHSRSLGDWSILHPTVFRSPRRILDTWCAIFSNKLIAKYCRMNEKKENILFYQEEIVNRLLSRTCVYNASLYNSIQRSCVNVDHRTINFDWFTTHKKKYSSRISLWRAKSLLPTENSVGLAFPTSFFWRSFHSSNFSSSRFRQKKKITLPRMRLDHSQNQPIMLLNIYTISERRLI